MALSSEDDRLLRRCREGHLEAFEELVRRHEKWVYGLAYRLCGNGDDALDLAQEAFIRVFNALASFRGESSFPTWLYRIVTNACLDELRNRARHPALSLDEPAVSGRPDLARQMPGDAPDPGEEAERHEVQAAVQKGISSLKPEHRVIIILRDIQDLPYEDIAAILRLPPGTVKSRLNRARLALREALAGMELFRERVVCQAEVQVGEMRGHP
jgi:RNA polymerase sigma-70 factor (ECF subfamily)